MTCDVQIFFGDTTTATTAGSGTQADPIVVNLTAAAGAAGTWRTNADGSSTWIYPDSTEGPTVNAPGSGGGGTECCNTTATFGSDASDLPILTITQSNGADAVANLCTETGGNGLTGQRIGAEIIGCGTRPLAGDDPETAGFDPADFPARWRQHFTGGLTGDELWVVLPDTNGDNDWHQIA